MVWRRQLGEPHANGRKTVLTRTRGGAGAGAVCRPSRSFSVPADAVLFGQGPGAAHIFRVAASDYSQIVGR